MILIGRLRSHRSVLPTWVGVVRPPLTLSGPLLQAARSVWCVMAASALAIWILEAPLVYRAALHLHNTSGLFTMSPAEWRIGLDRLGLSPSVYAIHAVGLLFLMTGTMFLFGVLIFIRRSNEWVGLVVSYTFVTVGTGIITAYAGGPALVKAHPELNLFLSGYTDLANIGWGSLFLIPMIFPDGRFVPRWSRWLVVICFVPFIISTSLNPLPIWITGPLNVLWFGTVLLSPLYRYLWVSDFAQREQTKWVMFGLSVALGLFTSLAMAETFIPWLSARPERTVLLSLTGGTLFYLGFTFLPISFAIAIFRYRLWDIDLIINRALVYVALTVCVIGLYVLVVGGLGAFFQSQASVALSLPATALVAILFHPLHERLQRGVNRLMYGQRDDPYTVLSTLGQQLERTIAPEALLPSIVETVARSLKLPYAAISVGSSDSPGSQSAAASWGRAVTEPHRCPLFYQGENVGELLLGQRAGEQQLSLADRRLVDDLSRQAGVAVHAIRLTSELRRARERLITAREEERRRLRRDLHDGLGPQLGSQTLTLSAARKLLRVDPVAAETLLDQAGLHAQQAIADIRRLVYDLRPPALDDLGLVAALREGVTQQSRNGLRVTLDAPEPLPPLPAAVEVACYRIVLEALTNVVRHGRARYCTVKLLVNKELSLEVCDDGQGLLPGNRPGVGMVSMRERATELGGTCTIEPQPAGGTRVFARLPIHHAQRAGES